MECTDPKTDTERKIPMRVLTLSGRGALGRGRRGFCLPSQSLRDSSPRVGAKELRIVTGGGHTSLTGSQGRAFLSVRMIAWHHTKPSPERGRWPEGPDEVASKPSPVNQGKAFFRSLGQLIASPDAGFSESVQSDKKVLAISGIYWYNIYSWYASQKQDIRKRPT